MQRTNVRNELKNFTSNPSGARTDVNAKPVENQILNSIPEIEYNLLRPHLESVQLEHHQILHEAG